MNLLARPELMDRLAAGYALGTLRGGARRRFEALARRHPALRAQALLWQERFLSLTELQPAEAPSPNVWKRIENIVMAEPRAAAAVAEPGLLRRARDWWRAGALAAVVAGVAAVAFTLNLQPQVRYVAVLMDDQARPAMLVTFDARSDRLMIRRVAAFQEGPQKSLQLWALPAAGAPRSLGVVGERPVAHMPMPEQVMGQSPLLAISLEPKGGVPGEGGPTGPVLWKGAVLQAPL